MGTFAEKECAPNSSLFDLRTYDGRTGRFHNPDPMWQYASPNMAMVNNPLSAVDPTGGEGSEGGSCPHSLVGTCCECEGTCPTGNSSSNSNGLTRSSGDGQGTSGGTGAPKLGAADLQDLILKSNSEKEIYTLYGVLSTVDNWIYEARTSNSLAQGLDNGTVNNETRDGSGEQFSDAVTGIAVSLTPIGVGMDAYTLFTGYDYPYRGGNERVGWGWRMAGIVPFVSEFRQLRKAGKLIKVADLAEWIVKNLNGDKIYFYMELPNGGARTFDLKRTGSAHWGVPAPRVMGYKPDIVNGMRKDQSRIKFDGHDARPLTQEDID